MYCEKCGKEICDDQKFCSICGEQNKNYKAPEENRETTPQTESQNPTPPPVTYPAGSSNINTLRCPNCGGRNLQTIVKNHVHSKGKDFSGKNACCGYFMFGPLGILCGSCGGGKQVTSTNTTVMACNDCGHEFRKGIEIQADIENAQKAASVQKIICFCVTTIAVIYFLCLFSLHSTGANAVFCLSMILLVVAGGWRLVDFENKKIAPLQDELEQFEQGQKQWQDN